MFSFILVAPNLSSYAFPDVFSRTTEILRSGQNQVLPLLLFLFAVLPRGTWMIPAFALTPTTVSLRAPIGSTFLPGYALSPLPTVQPYTISKPI